MSFNINPIIVPFYNGFNRQSSILNTLMGSINNDGSFSTIGTYFSFDNFNKSINTNSFITNSEPQPLMFANPVAGTSNTNNSFNYSISQMTDSSYCPGYQWNFLLNSSFDGVITNMDKNSNFLFNLINNNQKYLQYTISGNDQNNNYNGFLYLLGYLNTSTSVYKYNKLNSPLIENSTVVANNIEVIWVPPHMVIDVIYESATNSCPINMLYVVRLIGYANDSPNYINSYYTNPSDWINYVGINGNKYPIDNIYVQNIYAYNGTVGKYNLSQYTYNNNPVETTSLSPGFVNLRCILGQNNNNQWVSDTCYNVFNTYNNQTYTFPVIGINDIPTKIMVYYKGIYDNNNNQVPMYWNVFVSICNNGINPSCGNIGSTIGLSSNYNSTNTNFNITFPKCSNSSGCGKMSCYTSSCTPGGLCLYTKQSNCTNSVYNPIPSSSTCSTASNCSSCKSGYSASCTGSGTCTCVPSSSISNNNNTKKYVEEGLGLLLIIVIFVAILILVNKYFSKKQNNQNTLPTSNVEFIPIQ